jgi:hypothetical protein
MSKRGHKIESVGPLVLMAKRSKNPELENDEPEDKSASAAKHIKKVMMKLHLLVSL